MRDIGKLLRKDGSVIDLSHAGRTCPIGFAEATSNIQVTMIKLWSSVRPSFWKASERSGPDHLCRLLVGDSPTCTRGSQDEKGERAAGPFRDLVTELKKAPGLREAEADEDDARTLLVLFGSHGERCRDWKEATRLMILLAVCLSAHTSNGKGDHPGGGWLSGSVTKVLSRSHELRLLLGTLRASGSYDQLNLDGIGIS